MITAIRNASGEGELDRDGGHPPSTLPQGITQG